MIGNRFWIGNHKKCKKDQSSILKLVEQNVPFVTKIQDSIGEKHKIKKQKGIADFRNSRSSRHNEPKCNQAKFLQSIQSPIVLGKSMFLEIN
jgi:hypothetical protein